MAHSLPKTPPIVLIERIGIDALICLADKIEGRLVSRHVTQYVRDLYSSGKNEKKWNSKRQMSRVTGIERSALLRLLKGQLSGMSVDQLNAHISKTGTSLMTLMPTPAMVNDGIIDMLGFELRKRRIQMGEPVGDKLLPAQFIKLREAARNYSRRFCPNDRELNTETKWKQFLEIELNKVHDFRNYIRREYVLSPIVSAADVAACKLIFSPQSRVYVALQQHLCQWTLVDDVLHAAEICDRNTSEEMRTAAQNAGLLLSVLQRFFKETRNVSVTEAASILEISLDGFYSVITNILGLDPPSLLDPNAELCDLLRQSSTIEPIADKLLRAAVKKSLLGATA